MGAPETVGRLSEGKYLELERAAEFKSEFFGGEMFAMAGGTLRHSLISTNLAGELRSRLKGGPCIPYNSDLRIKITASGLLTYPDISVICDPPEFLDDTEDTVLNPTLLAEVLSDSTEAYDRGKKFEQYRQISSLRGYLLVSQNEPRIEQFTRQPDGRWILTEGVGLENSLEVPSLQITLALAEVFAKVKFVSVPFRAPPAV